MAEYIDCDAAIALAKDIIVPTKSGHDYRHRCIDPQDLAELPAADVVEVVRCADCKWFQCNMRQDGYLPHNVSEYECRHWCGPCDPTDYCSYGEPPKEES